MKMANVQWHTVEQYYELLFAGVIEGQGMRVGDWIEKYAKNGMTRNHLCHGVFNIIIGLPEMPDFPQGKFMALDGGPHIKWRSFGGAVQWLLGKNPNKIPLIRESIYTVEDAWSETKKQAKLLFPLSVPQYKILTPPSEWPPQMEMPLDH